MTTPSARLELRDLSRRFGSVRALDGVSLAVAPGEIVALLGESGCGKSTLLRVIAGLERADSGDVLLDGVTIGASVPPEARGIGMMFQDYALFPHLTVGENVRFGLGRGADARAIALRRLEQVGLTVRERDYPATLSGGESQRVALARALAPEPRIVLLDEPFSNLDRRTGDRVRAETIALLRATATTAILVTHDPEEALVFADRIALLREGRLVQYGTGEDLYRNPASSFAVRMFGSCCEVEGTCLDGRVATPFGDLPVEGRADGARLRVCLRPEALRPTTPGAGGSARILRRSFAGTDTVLVLAIEGLDGLMTLPVPHAAEGREGERIDLALTGKGAFVFAE